VEGAQAVIRRLVRFVDERTGSAPLVRKALRYVFPDHWSFLLGEIALYSFVVLVLTGIYLTIFFEPSLHQTVYTGSYEPLHGRVVTEAYSSALNLSFEVKAGLLMRQTHHWAADVFLVAIVLHLVRVFFTGAFRKPRDLVYYLGVAMLMLAMLEGFLGYSLLDDLLSGMGIAIAYAVVLSIPVIGASLGMLIWGGTFPTHAFEFRAYIAHVLIFPVLIGTLLALHLLLLAARHHTQFRSARATEARVVGYPAFPGYAPRSFAIAFATAAVLFLLGGLVQINPIWQYGPYETGLSTNGAQPDWYLGWLIGALRITPGFDVTVFGYTLVPNPFWGGALLPLVAFGFLFAWPWLERRLTGDRAFHNLLDRPRDNPWRTGIGAAFFTCLAAVFLAGSADRLFVEVGISYTAQVWIYRVAFVVGPVVAYFVAKRIAEELRENELRPFRGLTGTIVERTPEGGFRAGSRGHAND
jgi:ubiquinol-cytochrome c reductase cytochrome b subunit